MTTKTKTAKTARTKKTSGKLALFVLAAAAFCGPAALAADKKPESYAVILATVFRETGHAFGGVEVTLAAAPAEAAPPGKPPKPPKPQKLVTSPRGEAVFRVPAMAMRYTLTVKPKGYKPLTKGVSIQGDERQDVNFLLEVDK